MTSIIGGNPQTITTALLTARKKTPPPPLDTGLVCASVSVRGLSTCKPPQTTPEGHVLPARSSGAKPSQMSRCFSRALRAAEDHYYEVGKIQLVRIEPRPQRATPLIRHITRSQKGEAPAHYISKQTGWKDLFVLLQGGDDSISWQPKPRTRQPQVQGCYHWPQW